MNRSDRINIIPIVIILVYIMLIALRGLEIITISWWWILAPVLLIFSLCCLAVFVMSVVLVIKDIIRMYKENKK